MAGDNPSARRGSWEGGNLTSPLPPWHSSHRRQGNYPSSWSWHQGLPPFHQISGHSCWAAGSFSSWRRHVASQLNRALPVETGMGERGEHTSPPSGPTMLETLSFSPEGWEANA